MINILPKQQKKELIHEYRIRFMSTIFFMVAILGFWATILMLPSYFFSNSKEVLIENKLKEFDLNNPVSADEDINNVISEINLNLQTLDAFWPDNIYINEIAQDIFDLLPNGISVNQFLYNEKTDGLMFFEIHGNAKNRGVLKDFKTIIESQENFANIDLPISNFIQKTNIDYIITFSLKSSIPKVDTKKSTIKNNE